MTGFKNHYPFLENILGLPLSYDLLLNLLSAYQIKSLFSCVSLNKLLVTSSAVGQASLHDTYAHYWDSGNEQDTALQYSHSSQSCFSISRLKILICIKPTLNIKPLNQEIRSLSNRKNIFTESNKSYTVTGMHSFPKSKHS